MLPEQPKNRPVRSQSAHKSEEAGNDRGAKGRRKVKAKVYHEERNEN